MTEFKEGDEVIIIKINEDEEAYREFVGEKGKITRFLPMETYPYQVSFEDEKLQEQADTDGIKWMASEMTLANEKGKISVWGRRVKQE